MKDMQRKMSKVAVWRYLKLVIIIDDFSSFRSDTCFPSYSKSLLKFYFALSNIVLENMCIEFL